MPASSSSSAKEGERRSTTPITVAPPGDSSLPSQHAGAQDMAQEERSGGLVTGGPRLEAEEKGGEEVELPLEMNGLLVQKRGIWRSQRTKVDQVSSNQSSMAMLEQDMNYGGGDLNELIWYNNSYSEEESQLHAQD